MVEFSERTKRILGMDNIWGPRDAFVGEWNWEDVEEDGRHFCVFVAVLHEAVVGYATCQWHFSITDAEGNWLGPAGEPVPARPVGPQSIGEFLETDPDDFEGTLETWCVEAIVVEPKFQRRGLGKLLLRTAAASLETTLEDMAYGQPISDAGAALLASVGLSVDQVRRCIA